MNNDAKKKGRTKKRFQIHIVSETVEVAAFNLSQTAANKIAVQTAKIFKHTKEKGFSVKIKPYNPAQTP